MGSPARDPLEDGPTEHTCDHGWVNVSRESAEREARHLMTDAAEPPAALVAAMVNSVYPCKWCQPTQFWRWAQGHWRPDHDITSCPECITQHGGRRAAGLHAVVSRDSDTGASRADRHAEPPPPEPPPDLFPDDERRDLA